ncbi:hypothetical protein CLI92_01255 [Vandammella animalimorsus]|uniref:Uncharacterized protein n=1 Tax=Vandammella animalimorsus TaxID=2029117 RepID=A0A2A2T8K0_9BURK|nr:hypothetical protein CLI92_01255 [Vandammella animalimorsus]PAX20650.1 hypothetical protein CLI93_02675 [Vandammella animalimorsus]
MGIALIASPWQTTARRVNHCYFKLVIFDDFLGCPSNHPIGLQNQTLWQTPVDKAPSMGRNATQLVAFVVYRKIQHGQERLLKITHQFLICDLHWSHKIRRRLIQGINHRQIAHRHGNTIVNVIIQRVGQELDQDGALILAAKHRKSGPAIDGL